MKLAIEYIEEEMGFPSIHGYRVFIQSLGVLEEETEAVRDFILSAQRHELLQILMKDSSLNAVAKVNEARSMLEDWQEVDNLSPKYSELSDWS